MNPLPVARGRLLLAAVTALALSACASSRALDGANADVLAIPLSPQQSATHVLLADFESQATLTGERAVVPSPAQPKVPGSHVEVRVSSKDGLGDALTMQWKDAWYASLRIELAQPADLRPFLADGALEFDLDAIEDRKSTRLNSSHI